jgi:hypothetical protein
LLESILIYQEYKNTLKRYLPVLVLDACADDEIKVGGMKVGEMFTLGMYHNAESIEFGRMGEIEELQFNGSDFSEKVYFLAKPI